MSKHAVVLFALVVAGCGGSQPKQVGEDNNFTQPEQSPNAGSGTSHPSASGESGGGLSEDQKKQMEIALRRGGEKASQCGDVVADAPRGKGEVQVTFDGTKGKVTEVSVGSPWAGTAVEPCIKRAFEKEYIMPFQGEPMEVPYTVEIPDKKGGAPKGSPSASPKAPPKK